MRNHEVAVADEVLDFVIDLIDHGQLISEKTVEPSLREKFRKIQDWIVERRDPKIIGWQLRIEELENENFSFHTEINDLNAENDSLGDELTELQDELEEARGELKALQDGQSAKQ